jgi:hypothetical protein
MVLVAKDKYSLAWLTNLTNCQVSRIADAIGRGQWVVVPAGQEQGWFKNLIGSQGDTEYVSIIESISASSTVIASLIIIKRVIIQTRWFADI